MYVVLIFFGSPYPKRRPCLPALLLQARGSQQDLVELGNRAERVKAYFKQHLGLEPFEETRAYVSFLVKRDQEADLIGFLQRLEADQREMGITGEEPRHQAPSCLLVDRAVYFFA